MHRALRSERRNMTAKRQTIPLVNAILAAGQCAIITRLIRIDPIAFLSCSQLLVRFRDSAMRPRFTAFVGVRKTELRVVENRKEIHIRFKTPCMG